MNNRPIHRTFATVSGNRYPPVPGYLPSILILLLFFLLSLIGILRHEIWLDEAQHFLIARDSHNLSELFHACRNEGHPVLWNVLLFFITRFSSDPFYMQLFHILISCITVVFLLRSDLSLAEKFLVIFGYFFFFEYNIISRNYGLSALMMILLVSVYKNNNAGLTSLAVILFILSQTHLFSLLFSVAFVFTYLITNRRDLLKQNRKILLASGLIILAGWIIAAIFIIPPGNYTIKFMQYDSSGYLSPERIVKTVSVVLKGIFYIPDYTVKGHQFINTFYFQTFNLTTTKIYILSLAAIIIPAIILKNSRFAFILYLSFLVIFIPVYYFLPLTYGIRYFGFFYVVFICCLLVARSGLSKTGIILSVLIISLQFGNGIYAWSMDFRYPFSEGKEVSKYIKSVQRKNEKVFILNPTLRPAISAYTGEKFFGTENGAQLSYCLWDEHLPDSILKSKLNYALNCSSTSLIVANNPFHNLIDTTKLELLASFNNGILIGENAAVYRYFVTSH